MSSRGSRGKDSVQHVNWPGAVATSAESTELKEVELVELALESYSAEIHPAHDQIDVKTYGGGFRSHQACYRAEAASGPGWIHQGHAVLIADCAVAG